MISSPGIGDDGSQGAMQTGHRTAGRIRTSVTLSVASADEPGLSAQQARRTIRSGAVQQDIGKSFQERNE